MSSLKVVIRAAMSSSLVLPVSPSISANPNSMIPELMALSTRNFSDASVERLSLARAIRATVASRAQFQGYVDGDQFG